MTPPALKARKIRSVVYAGVLVVSGVFSPLALGLGLLLRWHASRSLDSRDSWRGIWAFALLGAALYGLMFWRFHPLVGLALDVWQAIRAGHVQAGAWSLLLLWGYQGLLAPLLSLVLEGLVKSTQEVHLAPRSVLSRPGRGRQTVPVQGAQIVAGLASSPFPEIIDGGVVVGQALSGNLWRWVRGSCFVYPREVLFYHAVALAQSGMGKSELLRRMAYALAKHARMKIFWIDGKGDWKDAARFDLTMRKAGCSRVGIFPVIQHAGWRGARQDVLNLLMATQIFESDYYRGVTYNILRLALYAPNLPAVSSGAELLRRIYPPTLLALYQSTREGRYLEALTTDALWGPYNKYQAFFSGVQDRLDGTLGYGDWDAAYYLLDEKRLQEGQLAPFARYLIDDFYLYLALRQVEGKQRPILLILDDFSSYSSRVLVHKLYERVRSSHGCVILSAQGYEALGDDAERLLEDAAVTIVGKCNLPEKLIRVAGKRKAPAFSYHLPGESEEDEQGLDEGEPSHTMMHEEERWLVEPDDVRRLGVGEVYMLYGAASHKIRVERVGLDEGDVEARAAELLQDYEGVQSQYEADLTQSIGVAAAGSSPQSGSQDGKKKRRRQKPAPPQPPQAEESPAGSGAGASDRVSSVRGSGPDPEPRTDEERQESPKRPPPSLDDIE
jgi:hypothetical protein